MKKIALIILLLVLTMGLAGCLRWDHHGGHGGGHGGGITRGEDEAIIIKSLVIGLLAD